MKKFLKMLQGNGNWKEKLLLLKNIKVYRCMKPSCGFEDIVEVYITSDAS